jgi:hypothetical protein
VPADSSRFFTRLRFPPIWIERNLYPIALRETQEALLSQESPGRVCGSEHYRYAAFCHYVKSEDTTEEQLRLLILAASQDPDDGMAQAALIDLVSHQHCTEDIYREALRVFRAFPEQYFEEDQLSLAYREKVPSWRQ